MRRLPQVRWLYLAHLVKVREPMHLRQFLPHRLLALWQPNGWYFVIGASVLIGGAAGVGVWIFKQLIGLFQRLAAELGGLPAPWPIVAPLLALMLGGLLVGLISTFWVGEERHRGVTGIIEAVALLGGRLHYWKLPAKVLGASLSIGCGASVGPEGPSAQIGANFGSLVGQLVRMTDERTRTLVAAGAAAGIAATFNAPITGVFFAVEIILGQISGSAMSAVLLASVVGAAVTQALSGPDPAFSVPAYHYNSLAELPLYMGLGLAAGPVAALYTSLLLRARALFHGLRIAPWLKPVLAGLLVGLIGIALPQVLGMGDATVTSILRGEVSAAPFLLLLAAAKLVATSISLGGGFIGGGFAPALFVGASLGGAYGVLAGQLLPGWGLDSGAFAMVGMAALLAGAIHAPLTAVMLLFELTNDYSIILPLMFAVTFSLLLSRGIQRDSVYTLGLVRRGIHLDRGRDVEILDSLRVDEVMQTDGASLAAVTDGAGAVGAVGAPRVLALLRKQLPPVAYPDETLHAALRRMSLYELPQLPVVRRDQAHEVVGLLSRTHIVRAYEVALVRRLAQIEQTQQAALDTVAGLTITRFPVEMGAAAAGKQVAALHVPPDLAIALIERGKRVIVPNARTSIEAGDILAVLGDDESVAALRRVCSHP
jgi:CIC family chloride channel protein